MLTGGMMAPYKPFPIGKNRIKLAVEKSLSEMIKLVKIEKKIKFWICVARFFRYIIVYLVVEKYFEFQVWICSKFFRWFGFLGNNLVQFSLNYIVIKSNGFCHATVLFSKKFWAWKWIETKNSGNKFSESCFFLHPKTLGSTVKTACRSIFIDGKCMTFFSIHSVHEIAQWAFFFFGIVW